MAKCVFGNSTAVYVRNHGSMRTLCPPQHRQVYDAASPGYTGRCTAPLLVDATCRSIVCNESSIIARNLCTVSLAGWHDAQLVPLEMQDDIDTLNDDIYNNVHASCVVFVHRRYVTIAHDELHVGFQQVNNGVYKAGFATSQAAHNKAAAALFDTLARLDARLQGQQFLHGQRCVGTVVGCLHSQSCSVTESDLWLYPTLIRLDAVYAVLFKVCKRRLVDYPNLHRWLGDMYRLQVPGPLQVLAFNASPYCK